MSESGVREPSRSKLIVLILWCRRPACIVKGKPEARTTRIDPVILAQVQEKRILLRGELLRLGKARALGRLPGTASVSQTTGLHRGVC